MQHPPKRTRKTRETTLEREERKRKQEEIDPFQFEPLKTQGLEFSHPYPFTPQQVELAYRRAGGVIARAAKLLNVNHQLLYYLNEKYPELNAAALAARVHLTHM